MLRPTWIPQQRGVGVPPPRQNRREIAENRHFIASSQLVCPSNSTQKYKIVIASLAPFRVLKLYAIGVYGANQQARLKLFVVVVEIWTASVYCLPPKYWLFLFLHLTQCVSTSLWSLHDPLLEYTCPSELKNTKDAKVHQTHVETNCSCTETTDPHLAVQNIQCARND